MPARTIDDESLTDAVSAVFSRHGYEGASINLLSEATGLGRASLYHRFPGGKDEMVQAIVERAHQRYAKALEPAFTDGPPLERAKQVAKGLDEYYQGGTQSCLVVALSVSDAGNRAIAGECVNAWAEALTNISLDAGLTPEEADAAAMDVVAAIEGGMVISVTSGKTEAYQRALETLPERLTRKG